MNDEYRFSFMGMKDAEEIAAYMIKMAKDERVAITLTCEPGRTEIRAEPWENIVVACPYQKDRNSSEVI